MFKIYNIRYLCILCISFLSFTFLTGCCKEKEAELQPELLIEFNKGSSTFRWNTEGKFLRINTPENYSWTLSISYPADQPQGWCYANITEGIGDKNVWITIDNNLSDKKREAFITVVLQTTGEQMELLIEQYTQSDEGYDVRALELPKIIDIEWFFTYSSGEFSLEYEPFKKHSKWVAWKLHRGHLGNSGRTDAWQWDTRIPTEYRPTQMDFSGYDRGHLCPSADRTLSREMNAQTFMYSNMTPQDGNLNQVIWNNLENKIRGWVSGYDTLYICAGGTILKSADISHYTSPSGMAVPKYNFKVILRKKASTGTYDAIGFWFENRSYSPKTQVTVGEVKTVRQIETLTGIDFFYNLPQTVQNEVENQFNPSAWGIN